MGRSEATGDRLEEAKHINRSLSALGDVMAALAHKDRAHVPFRNSKLTQLLQDSLCGQAKAMMFIHIAPEVGTASGGSGRMQRNDDNWWHPCSSGCGQARSRSAPLPALPPQGVEADSSSSRTCHIGQSFDCTKLHACH